MDIDKLLDETVEKSADIDGWISRKAALKIQKAKGSGIPKFARNNMKGMTEEMRQKYRAILLKRQEKGAQIKKKRDEYNSKMERAQIERKLQNANLLSSFKERKKVENLKKTLARKKAEISNKIAQERMAQQKALVVRNATQPEIIKAQAEKTRVLKGREFGKRISKNNTAFELAVRPTDKTPTSGSPVDWVQYLRMLYRDCVGYGHAGRGVYYTDQFRQAVLGIPQDVLVKLPGNVVQKISALRREFANPAIAGLGGLGKMTPTETENIKGRIKRDFLVIVAKSRATIDPSDKMNIMRQFWDKWQPTLMSMPHIYNWFINDQHVMNAIADFRGIGEWELTEEEKQYHNMKGSSTELEREYLIDDRPGTVSTQEAIHPIAYDEGYMWDVEALMPNVPTPQPNIGSLVNFSERFDVEKLSKIKPIQPNVRLPNKSRASMSKMIKSIGKKRKKAKKTGVPISRMVRMKKGVI